MSGLRVSMALALRKTRRGWEGFLARWLAEKQRGIVFLSALTAAWLIVAVGLMPGLIGGRLAFIGGGSELLVDVGSFLMPAGTGSQSVSLTAGKTWTPKAIIFLTGGSRNASGTWFDENQACLGFTTGPSNSYAVGAYSLDAGTPSNTARRMAAKALTWSNSSGTAANAEADLTSFSAGGFTLNWTTNAGDRAYVMYVALGGDIQAEVLNWTTSTSTGNRSATTGTFQPDLVFHLFGYNGSIPQNNTGARGCLGAMNSAGEQWALSWFSDDAVNPANTSRWQRTDSTLLAVNASEGTLVRASFVSMDANGFTVNNAIAPGTSVQIASLCIKGVKSKLGAFNKSGAAAPVTQSITAPGFQPALTLLASDMDTANTSPNLHSTMAVGASDGTNHRVAALLDRDGVNPTQADSLWRSDAAWVGVSLGPVENSRGTIAHTATGFDLTLNPNDASLTQILYATIAAKD